MQQTNDISTDGPGFLSGLLWAAAVLTMCTFAVGALYQGAEPNADVVAAQR